MKESLKKKELKKEVERIHKSTKTTFPYFQPIHDKLRQKFRVYYFWHTLPFSNFVHILILLLAIFGFFNLLLSSIKIWQESKYTRFTYTLLGKRNWENFEHSSNIVFDKGDILLAKQDGSYPILGFLEVKIDAQKRVSWEKISFSGEIPSSCKNCKIRFRVKVSDEDKEEIWESLPWSDFYEKPENKIIYSGKINPQGRYLLLGIILESDGLLTPRLQRVNVSYVVQQPPSRLVLWIQDKLRKYLPLLFEKIYQRYNEFGFSYPKSFSKLFLC